jgi:hypothetical protein
MLLQLHHYFKFNCYITKTVAPEHEYKLFSPSGVNVPGLPSNWLWRVGSVAGRFYCLKTSPKGFSLERFTTLSKKKTKTVVEPGF